MSAVEISNVVKIFNQGRSDEVLALSDVDLTVGDGEFVSLIGPSGCGKSTLLRLIADLIPPTTGSVSVAGKPAGQARREQAYGLAFQQAGLFDWRTVRKNVELPLELRGIGRAERRTRAEEMLALVGLSEFAGHYPGQLSGGMQQRVALCRALIQRPRVLLMDEPFSALDALTREELAIQLQAMHLTAPATTVFVTHSIPEAVLLADRVVVLSARPGRVRRVLEVGLPRPRSFGHHAHVAQAAECVAELHDLLLRD